MEWFYDKHGQAVFFKYDERLISKKGENICWIFGNYVYSLKSGRHIGWFEDGKIYDIENNIIAFLKNASGLPCVPGFSGTPGTPGIPGKPGTPGLGGLRGRPGYHGFSKYDALDYFYNNK